MNKLIAQFFSISLYIISITCKQEQKEPETHPLAGFLFKAVPGVKGINSTFFGNINK